MSKDTDILLTELHRQTRPVTSYKKVYSPGKSVIWAIDLMIMPQPDNEYLYAMVAVDVFTRYVWFVPLKKKDTKSLWEGLLHLIQGAGATPMKLWGDQESGWYSNAFQKSLKQKGIELYSTYNEFGSPMVERAIRTLKSWAQKKYELQGSYAWVKVLQSVVKFYNTEHVHSVLKTTPAQAYTMDQEELRNRLYNTPPTTELKKPKFSVGQFVRVSRKGDIFEKSYHAHWSYLPYRIREISKDSTPIGYYLEESDGKPVAGIYYENELQATKVPYAALVQNIVKKKKKDGVELSFVQYRGIPERYNRWIPSSEVQLLGGGQRSTDFVGQTLPQKTLALRDKEFLTNTLPKEPPVLSKREVRPVGRPKRSVEGPTSPAPSGRRSGPAPSTVERPKRSAGLPKRYVGDNELVRVALLP